jgi:cysteine-rich repeat protein
LDIVYPREPVCGDGVVAGEEECDDGQGNNSDTVADACRVDCSLPSCGDGVADPGNSEECDDGGLVDGDGCASDCTVEFCGDGQVNNAETEECDEGSNNSNTTPDACRVLCLSPSCGDGVTDTGEVCDDGNNVSQDGCNATCAAIEDCGDAIVQAGLGEECDDGDGSNSNTAPDACRLGCVNPTCGDGVTDPANSEECDDGNQDDSDGCSNKCTICGNGVVSGDETCDDGPDNSDTMPDACRANCQIPFCGDGVIDPANSEVCDDNNTNPNDLCTNSCQFAACGDGLLCTDPILCATGPDNGTEDCDEGGANSDTAPDACRLDCSTATCGDGVVDSGESCDGEANDNCASNEACLDSCECKHLCPGAGELTLFSGTGPNCATNGDCIVGNCDPGLGRCVTVTELDSGWNGLAHDADINDVTVTRGFLDCPATGPVCGECEVAGVDPSGGNCRCSADNKTLCDETFSKDSDCDFGGCASKVCDDDPQSRSCNEDADCFDEALGNLGDCKGTCSGNDSVICRTDDVCQESDCLCFFGSPFPLSSGGTPACVVNRFFEDITGTGNVDTGQGAISANLRTQVFLGEANQQPCPVCGGRCEGDESTLCLFDEECGVDGVCLTDEIVNDGVRGGTCVDGADDGTPCDVNAVNTSFPARSKSAGGGGYSLDCMPTIGKNVSGVGLVINLTQKTGIVEMAAQVPCGTDPSLLCPCKMCTADTTVPCNSDSDCAGQVANCSTVTRVDCVVDDDCASVDAGPCISVGPSNRCSGNFSERCTTNGDCENLPGGTCNQPSCASVGAGNAVQPNQCSDGVCVDQGGGEGECNVGPNERTCDGLVRANGNGILGCGTNADCGPGVIGLDGGNCTLERRRECFLDPIVAVGAADPNMAIGAAAFCVPPTSSAGINGAAGLPGPGRIVNQSTAITFCAEDPDSVYTPGVGGCPQ